MEREQAIRVALGWLRDRGRLFGRLRFAGYTWDFRSGSDLRGGRYTQGLIPIGTLGSLLRIRLGLAPHPPTALTFVHGWLVVFDPAALEPTCPEECFAVWVPEPDGPARGREPRGPFDITLPLTGGSRLTE